MSIYMKYDAITGDVTETGHKDWIECHSFQWGVGRALSSTVGSSADRESTAPSVGQVTITKDNDVATGKLMAEALGGHGKTVKLDFVRTDKGKLDVYLSLELTNTLISDYSMGGSDRPGESVTLSFTKVAFSTKQMKDDATEGQNFTSTYDLETAQLT